MNKLLELEKKLKEAKAELEKNGGRFSGMAGSVATSGGPSIASQIGFGKAEDKKEEDEKKKKKNPDAKEDAELGEEVEHAVERHFKDNAKEEKEEGHKLEIKKGELEKGLPGNKFGNKQEQDRMSSVHEVRQPATSIDPKTGAKTLITPKEQVAAQQKAVANKKAKAEAEAAARRAAYRKDGVVKGDSGLSKTDESISFNGWGQWSLEKSKDMEAEVESDKAYNGEDQPKKGPKVKREKL